MQTKAYISIVLLFAFSLAMIHNIVPHTHIDEVSETVHHHDGTHEHHSHDKKYDENNEDDDSPFNFFEHYSHLATTIELSFVFSSNIELNPSTNLTYCEATKIDFNQVILSAYKAPPKLFGWINSEQFDSTYSLRGPPSLA